MVYVRTTKRDIWENKKTKEQYNPVKVIRGSQNGDDFIVIRGLETSDEIKISIDSFRSDYRLIRAISCPSVSEVIVL